MGCNLCILLWHHFRFYRHKLILLLTTLLMPFFLLGCIYMLVLYQNNGAMMDMETITECKLRPAKPSLAIGAKAYIPYVFCGPSRTQNCVKEGNSLFMTNTDEFTSECRPEAIDICEVNDWTSEPVYYPAASLLLYVHPNLSAVDALIGHIREAMQEFVEEIKTVRGRFQFKSTDCVTDARNRIIGFESEDEALNFARNLSTQTEHLSLKLKLWGVVDFISDSSAMASGVFDYRMIRDVANFDETASWHLQSVIESAMIQVATKSKNDLLLKVQDVPTKCWKRTNSMSYNLLASSLPFIAVCCFFLSPLNALQQMLVEKELKLKEYLRILGVSNFELKFSWWTFYMLFLVPLSFWVTIFLYFFPAAAFGATNIILIFILFVFYNMAQLSWVFFFSTIFHTPKTATNLFQFIHVFLCLVVTFLIGSLEQLNGPLLIGCLILSLHPVIPLSIGLKYAVAWEQNWIGLSFGNSCLSPFPDDGYGGFSMCLVWLFVETILYMALTWYIDHVNPGEFGKKQKPYFCCQPSFWSSASNNCKTCTKSDAEASLIGSSTNRTDENNLKPSGLKLINLTKIYENGQVGVADLSISFVESEIIGFLGLNGAGKSTTMNSIVGLINPTAGEIYLDDQNIQSVPQIHYKVAFVPQYDILYPNLTLEDHLYFYGKLKCKKFDRKSAKTEKNLELLDLARVKNVAADKLSGGQKRKLSVLIAYIGDPSVVILDEPTSGVDPQSRKVMWDFILQDKERRTTILSTHHLQEADLLSDRIAIISGGTLNCYGTSYELRQKYDVGLRFIVATNNDTLREEIVHFFKSKINLDVAGSEPSQLSFPISSELATGHLFLETLAQFEDKQCEFKYDCFGLSKGSLEEVFFRATGLTEPAQATENADEANGEYAGVSDTKYPKTRCMSHFISALYGLTIKRFQFFKRSWVHILYQFFLPLLFVLLLLLIGSDIHSDTPPLQYVQLEPRLQENLMFVSSEITNLDLKNQFVASIEGTGLGYKCSEVFEFTEGRCPAVSRQISPISKYSAASCEDCSHYCSLPESRQRENVVIPTEQIVYEISPIHLHDWILTANDSEHNVIGGFVFNKNSYLTVVSDRHIISAMINSASNAILRSKLKRQNAAIRFSIKYAHIDLGETAQALKSAEKVVKTLIASVFLIQAFIFTTYGIINYIMLEKTNGLRRLQRISDCGVFAYWMSNFLADLLLFCATFLCIVLLIALIPNSFRSNLLPFCLLLLPFGPASIAFIYFISYFFATKSSAETFISVSVLISTVAAAVLTTFEIMNWMCRKNPGLMGAVSAQCLFGWAVPVNAVLRFIPSYYLCDAVLMLAFIVQSSFSDRPDGPIQRNHMLVGDIYGMNFIGKYLLEGFMSFLFYFGMVLLFEWLNVDASQWCGTLWQKVKSLCRRKSSPSIDQRSSNEAGLQLEIFAEKNRVSNPSTDDILLVQEVSKTYPTGNVAVESVSFGVPKKQCFGLLGTNGAGKTTLFKILTGYLSPSAGKVRISGQNAANLEKMFAGHYSYCPQENMLFDFLTVTEHLRLFCRLKGVSREQVENVCDSLVKECELSDHRHKLSNKLSGGNQRKLQLAISLIGLPPIVFLDEPTTGMDPFARKRAWTAINRVCAAGSAVLLTSHTMEECEALCHRIVILVAGKVKCIGGIQKLKNSLGNRHVVSLYLRNLGVSTAFEIIENLKTELVAKFNGLRILEENFRILKFDIEASSIRLSQLLSVLLELKGRYSFVADYSVSQLTFEEIFVAMAEKQNLNIDWSAHQDASAISNEIDA